MAARRRKLKTFKLEVDRRKKDLNRSIATAEKALKAGQAALKRARKRGDANAVEANRLALRDNRWVLRNLNASFDALEATCVDQFLNSDPTYEG